MKTLTLFFILFFFQGFSQNLENDSINKKDHKFLFGITLAPNYSWRQYHYEKDSWTGFSYGGAEFDYPSMGYSILLNGKITKRKFMFNIGVGMSFFSYEGTRTYGYNFPISWMEVRYEYNHKLFGINTGYSILLGKNKLWNLGIIADINYIYSLIEKVKTDVYMHGTLYSEYERTYDFTHKQLVFWSGLEFGRSINIAKWLIINISASGKYSSTIYSEELGKYQNNLSTQPRSLMALSLNISFYPIFKRK